MDAVEIIDNLFSTNQYQTYKLLEDKLIQLRNEFKSRMLEDEVRRVFHSQGIVAKYIRNRVFQVNQIGLNQFLNDYGLLVNTAKFETNEKLDKFKNEQTYHLRINAKLPSYEYDFSNLDESELTKEWNKAHDEYKALDYIVSKAKKKIAKCSKLKKEMKLKFSNGSLSLAKNRVSYNIQAIAEEFGIDYIIQNAKTSSEKIDLYIEQGFIIEKDLDQFRTLMDINLKFTVMKLSDEQVIYDILKRKQIRAYNNRQLDVI
ncbi:MAG: hypothetical protein K0R18_390 [Bacillales bacterium]|jgi:hypothetical protein|nr:hypothetical protein [Bacillales bacterium]